MAQLYFEDVSEGMEIPPLTKYPTHLMMFTYCSSVMLTDRIHWDQQYAKEVQNLPDQILPGTVPGHWTAEMLINWIGEEGTLKKIAWSLRGMTVPSDVITCKGRVTRKYVEGGNHYVECDTRMENQRGDVNAPGSATVILPARGR